MVIEVMNGTVTCGTLCYSQLFLNNDFLMIKFEICSDRRPVTCSWQKTRELCEISDYGSRRWSILGAYDPRSKGSVFCCQHQRQAEESDSIPPGVSQGNATSSGDTHAEYPILYNF